MAYCYSGLRFGNTVKGVQWNGKSDIPADMIVHWIPPSEEGGVLLKCVCSVLFWLSDYFLLYHTMA